MANDQGWFSGKTKISLTVPDKSAIQVKAFTIPAASKQPRILSSARHGGAAIPSKGAISGLKTGHGQQLRSQVADSAFQDLNGRLNWNQFTYADRSRR
jgi:hypothetical protein